MRTDAAFADERLVSLALQMMTGNEAEAEAAVAEIDRIAERAWRREPRTLSDLRELALIARTYLDTDPDGNPVADCAESEAMLRLIDGVLRMTVRA